MSDETAGKKLSSQGQARTHFWTPDKIARLAELLTVTPPLSAKQIALELGTTRNAIIARCNRNNQKLGIRGQSHSGTAQNKENIKRLAEAGWAQWQIARELGMSARTVSYHTNKMGLKIPNWRMTPGMGKKRPAESSGPPEFEPGAWEPKWVRPIRRAAKKARRNIAEQRGESHGKYLARLSAQSRRRRQGMKQGGSIEEMRALVAASDVPVTKCPPGAHLTWLPDYLR